MDLCILPSFLRTRSTVTKASVYLGNVSYFDGLGSRCTWDKCFPVRSLQDAGRRHNTVPIHGYPNNSWIGVVRHMRDPDHMGFWMYMSLESDVKFNLGRTIAFENHIQAMQFFLPHNMKTKFWEVQFVNEARKKGYDSIQFTRFVEYGYLKHELVFTQLNSLSATAKTRCHHFEHVFQNLPKAKCTWMPSKPCNTEIVFRNHNRR